MAKKAHRPESHLARSLGSKEIQWDGVYTPYISDGVTDVAVDDMVVKQDLDQLAVKSVNGKAGNVVVDLPDFPVVNSAISAERTARVSADASLQQQINDNAANLNSLGSMAYADDASAGNVAHVRRNHEWAALSENSLVPEGGTLGDVLGKNAENINIWMSPQTLANSLPIAQPDQLGVFRPDGVTLTTDPVTGATSAIGGGGGGNAVVTTANVMEGNLTQAQINTGFRVELERKADTVYVDTGFAGLQTTLNAKAPLASPALTGAPTAPTPTAGTSNQQIATAGFTHQHSGYNYLATASANETGYIALTVDTLPSTRPPYFSVKFKSPAAFSAGKAIRIGTKDYAPYSYGGEALADDFFVTDDVVTANFDEASAKCFFRRRGGAAPGLRWRKAVSSGLVKGSMATAGNGKFVAVPFNTNTTTAEYSEDGGRSWMTTSFPAPISISSPVVQDVKYCGDTYVCSRWVDKYTQQIITSTDGRTWSSRQVAVTDFDAIMSSIAYSSGTIFSTAINMTRGLYSTDSGMTWTRGGLYGGNQYSEIGASDSLFVAGSTNLYYQYFLRSAPSWVGSSWSSAAFNVSNPVTVGRRSIQYHIDRFIALGIPSNASAGIYYLLSSPDAVTWSSIAMPTALSLFNGESPNYIQWSTVVSHKDMLVAVGTYVDYAGTASPVSQTGFTCYSSNLGLSWTLSEEDADQSLFDRSMISDGVTLVGMNFYTADIYYTL